MVTSSDVEGAGKLARSRTEVADISDAAALLHHCDSTAWFKRPNQDKPIRFPFHEHIQHPMHAVVEIDVGSAGFVAFNKRARARSCKSVRGFIVNGCVGFNLDDNSCALFPNELRPDQFTGATERIAPKEFPTNHLSLHRTGPQLADSPAMMS